MSAAGLAEAVAGCAILTSVLRGGVASALTFDGFLRLEIRRLDALMPALQAELEGPEAESADFDTLMRRLYLHRVESEEFREGELSPVAAIAARSEVCGLLVEHLAGAEEGGGDAEADGDVRVKRWAGVLHKTIRDAILIKCKASCARVSFDFPWVGSGQPFDLKSMESTHGRRPFVLCSVFPGLSMERDGQWEVLAKTTVKDTRTAGV